MPRARALESQIAFHLMRAPGLRSLFALRPRRHHGRTLDADARLILSVIALNKPPGLHQLGPKRARAAYDSMPGIFEDAPLEIPTRDLEMHLSNGDTLNARLYETDGERRPVLVYLHGGGFVVGGGFRAHDRICRTLARLADVAVLSVDYRLSPEAPFPAAVDDAYGALCWVAEHARSLGLDPERIAIGGDSAGGNLALVCCLRARDEGGPKVRFQLLVYPAVDPATHYPSRDRFSHGFFVELPTMDWFLQMYTGGVFDADDPRLCPLRAPSFAGLPPAHVITAGFDPLCDEGEACAHRLAREGVPTTYRCYEGQIHGFYQMAGVIAAGRHALEESARHLRHYLAT